MRIYIISNDGIALCREAPAALNDGEIVVTSKDELHATPLNGKRLLVERFRVVDMLYQDIQSARYVV